MHCVDSQSDEIGEERDDSRQLLNKRSIIKQGLCDLPECGRFVYKHYLAL